MKICLLIAAVCVLSACSITRPLSENAAELSLTSCPSTPNCVHTEAKKEGQQIAPFTLVEPIQQAWPKVIAAVKALPGSKIKVERPGYVYAKQYTRFLRYVDYLEVLHQSEKNTLEVRSSSRLGLSDLGVNRKRTEKLRKALLEQGVIR